jgi:hypothetical protein
VALYTSDGVKQFLIVRFVRRIVRDPAVCYRSVLIKHEHRPVRDPVQPEFVDVDFEVVLPNSFARYIADEVKFDTVFFAERALREWRVTTYSENRRSSVLKFVESILAICSLSASIASRSIRSMRIQSSNTQS